jgi:perosamine synthetase
MGDFIPYGHQYIDEEDKKAVLAILESDWLTQGPAVQKFEFAMAEYAGARYGVAFSSGTAALHASCFAAGMTRGKEAITSPLTFVASANSILYCGGRPVFADIDCQTGLIDPKEIKKKITTNTRVIIPVDFAGQPCDLDAIVSIARENNLIVIEDSAHALGAEYKGKRIGSISDMTVFSFHPVKHITTGEGGMVLTNREDLYKKLILFRNHGITKDPKLMKKHEGPWYYEMIALGYNYRITDFQSALGLSQLQKLPHFLEKRRKIALEYRHLIREELKDRVYPLFEKSDIRHAYHLFPVRIKFEKAAVSRKDLMESLAQKGIGTQVHYIPVHLHPYYQKKFGIKRGEFPEAEELYEEILSLPIFPFMPQDGPLRVVKHLRELLN